MKFYAPEKIGSKRTLTPEGYLLIEGTPIARTGIQEYAPEELGFKIAPGPDGIVLVERKPEEVFNPISMASYNGKSFSNDHPPDLIGPMTWRELTRGVVMNPRRGEGDASDLLLVDLMVCDAGAIALIEAGKVELSCGYTAEYFEIEPGRGEQRNIIGNHLALVSEGRCGSRCSISDHHHPKETTKMPTLKDKLMKLVGVKDEAELKKALDAEMPEGGEAGSVVINLGAAPAAADEEEKPDPFKALSDRMDAMEKVMTDVGSYVSERRAADKKTADEAAEKEKAEKEKETGDAAAEEELEKEAPKGTGDAARKATDSQYLSDAHQASVAMAEILVPGIKAPTFDRAAPAKKTLDTLTEFRRKALDLAYVTPSGRTIIDDLMAGKAFDSKTMDCNRVREVFIGAATAQKIANNAGGNNATKQNRGTQDGNRGKISSIADLQRRANEIYQPSRAAAAKTTH